MKTSSRPILWLTGAAIAALLTACGGTEPTTPGDGDGDGDPIDQNDGNDYTYTPNVVVHVTDWAFDAPLRAAHVAFDAPDGTRYETKTNVHGDAVFSDIEWERDDIASVVVYAEGFYLSARVGITEEEAADPIEMYVGRRELADITVPITGTADGESSLNMLSVATDQRVQKMHEAQGHNYSIGVTPDEPFTLSAFEWRQQVWDTQLSQDIFNWWRYDSDGISEDMTLNLDEGMSVATESVKGTMQYPGDNHPMHDQSFFVATTYAGVGGVPVGLTTMSDRDPMTRRFDFEVEQWASYATDDMETIMYLVDYEHFTLTRVPGRLTSGDYAVSWLAPAHITVPAAGEERTVYEGVELANPHPDVDVFLMVPEWGRVDAPRGATSIAFPHPPSAADMDTAVHPGFFNREVEARVMLCEADSTEFTRCQSLAASVPVKLQL